MRVSRRAFPGGTAVAVGTAAATARAGSARPRFLHVQRVVEGVVLAADIWDGYEAERERLLGFLRRTPVQEPSAEQRPDATWQVRRGVQRLEPGGDVTSPRPDRPAPAVAR